MSINRIHIALLTLFVALQPGAANAYGCTYGYSDAYGYADTYSQSGYYQYSQSSYQTTVNAETSIFGDLSVFSAISKGSGTFLIDHPLDPKNKLLYHSFVESPEVKNMYDGIVVLDKNGEAIVRLPTYFDALNGRVRYQLKPIGASMPNLHVKKEELDNQFAVGGGKAGGKVSWQITGVRHDPYILANPIIPEVEKGPDQLVGRGEYLYPEVVSKAGILDELRRFFQRLFGST